MSCTSHWYVINVLNMTVVTDDIEFRVNCSRKYAVSYILIEHL